MGTYDTEFMSDDNKEKIFPNGNGLWIYKHSIWAWIQDEFLGYTHEEAKKRLIELGKEKIFYKFMNG